MNGDDLNSADDYSDSHDENLGLNGNDSNARVNNFAS